MSSLPAQQPVPAGPAIEAELDHLLGQMTLEEKLLQLISYAPNGVPRLGIPNLRSGEALHGVVSEVRRLSRSPSASARRGTLP